MSINIKIKDVLNTDNMKTEIKKYIKSVRQFTPYLKKTSYYFGNNMENLIKVIKTESKKIFSEEHEEALYVILKTILIIILKKEFKMNPELSNEIIDFLFENLHVVIDSISNKT